MDWWGNLEMVEEIHIQRTSTSSNVSQIHHCLEYGHCCPLQCYSMKEKSVLRLHCQMFAFTSKEIRVQFMGGIDFDNSVPRY